MTVRFALKDATDQFHREIDERLSHLDLGTAQDYRRFLDFQARTIPAMEDALESAGISGLIDDWSDHRRSKAIESDLRALGSSIPPTAKAPPIAGVAELLGTAYVLEGSRLGSRVIRRKVGNGMPVKFLSDDGSLGSWPSLLEVMERFLSSGDALDQAKHAACRSFAWNIRVAQEAGIS